ncbi:MAG: hypothetical protein AAB420_02210 [Patescibacteria group bacterium]
MTKPEQPNIPSEVEVLREKVYKATERLLNITGEIKSTEAKLIALRKAETLIAEQRTQLENQLDELEKTKL